jgi:hypothetical protein
MLDELSPLILAHRGDGSMSAAELSQDHPAETLILGGYALQVVRRHDRKSPFVADRGYVLAIADSANRFIVAGKDVEVTFAAQGAHPAVVELDTVEEGRFSNGLWIAGRRLNGDDTMLDYDFSELAPKNQTGTGLRFGADGPTTMRVTVFRRDPGRP